MNHGSTIGFKVGMVRHTGLEYHETAQDNRFRWNVQLRKAEALFDSGFIVLCC